MNCSTDTFPPSLLDRPFWFPHFKVLRETPGLMIEDAWAFDKDWKETAYLGDKTTWLRLVIDLSTYSSDGTEAMYIDLKTGKRDGNEIKHSQQLLLYAMAGFRKHEHLQRISLAIWYLDHDFIKSHPTAISRREAKVIEATYMNRSNRLLQDKHFIPQPSKYNCGYCSYKDKCEFAWSKKI